MRINVLNTNGIPSLEIDAASEKDISVLDTLFDRNTIDRKKRFKARVKLIRKDERGSVTSVVIEKDAYINKKIIPDTIKLNPTSDDFYETYNITTEFDDIYTIVKPNRSLYYRIYKDVSITLNNDKTYTTMPTSKYSKKLGSIKTLSELEKLIGKLKYNKLV